MTVAAVILAATPESALADADGLATVRRIADVAWAGGAVPLVVVSSDPAGDVRAALAGASVTLAEPPPVEGGAIAQVRRGIEVALSSVRETSGALVWPAEFVWVGPETVTSLIEAHGVRDAAALRPAYRGEAGWPVLVPAESVSALDGVAPEMQPPALVDALAAGGVSVEAIELGDPGSVHDRATPRAELPPYEGPPRPAGGHVHEWGAAVADTPDDAPLEGPALAPYGQAVASDPEQPG